MKRHTVSRVRTRLAEAGKPDAPRRRRRKSFITYMAPALIAGQWSWDWGLDGPRFRDQRTKK